MAVTDVGNGHTNGHANGLSNGANGSNQNDHANGYSNGLSNGPNGHTNGMSNGANGNTNGLSNGANGHANGFVDGVSGTPVAICGMAMRLPGGIRNDNDLYEFLYNKGDARSIVGEDRYNIDGYYSAHGQDGTINTKQGYFLKDIDY